MKNLRTKFFLSQAAVLVIVGGVAMSTLTGCDSEAPAKAISTQNQVEDMVKARKIFDESDKNFDNLPADKKADYVKLTGGTEEKAKRWWDRMSHPGGGPTPNQGPTGPSGTGG